MKKYDDAIKMAEKFISLDDSKIYGYLAAIYAYAHLNQYEKVIENSNRLLEIDSSNLSALTYRAGT